METFKFLFRFEEPESGDGRCYPLVVVYLVKWTPDLSWGPTLKDKAVASSKS